MAPLSRSDFIRLRTAGIAPETGYEIDVFVGMAKGDAKDDAIMRLHSRMHKRSTTTWWGRIHLASHGLTADEAEEGGL